MTSWDDPRLQQLNPGLKLPRQDIALVVRQDGSGTTYAFTNHLSAISTEVARARSRRQRAHHVAPPGHDRARQ